MSIPAALITIGLIYTGFIVLADRLSKPVNNAPDDVPQGDEPFLSREVRASLNMIEGIPMSAEDLQIINHGERH